MSSLNWVFTFLFSIMESVIFISLLSRFRKNIINYKYNDIIVISISSILMFILTFLGITSYLKVMLISIILFLITYFYNLQLHERFLIISLHYFILIGSELFVTLLLTGIMKMDLETIQSVYNFSFLFLGVISKFLNIILISIIKKNFMKDKIILPRFINYITISLLSVSSISMGLLFFSSINSSIYDIKIILLIVCLLILFMSVGVLIMYFFANHFYINLQKETTRSIYNKSFEKFITNAEVKEDTLSKIWHDMKNHINILEKMDSNNDNYYEYLNSIKTQLNNIPNQINSGNDLINIILNDKYIEADSQGINFNIKAVAPPDLNIDDLHLSSILFNTIDNAIEACSNGKIDDRYINLEIYPDGDFLYFKIQNSYDSSYDNYSEKVNSHKNKYIGRGYGLKIVEDIINKHEGYIEIDKGDKEFSVIIILNLGN